MTMPFDGQHRCNHDNCGHFGSYTLIDPLHGWYVYACKEHRAWAYALADDEDEREFDRLADEMQAQIARQ